MSAEVFGLTQQILMLISAYINTGVCGKLHLRETTHFWQNCDNIYSSSFQGSGSPGIHVPKIARITHHSYALFYRNAYNGPTPQFLFLFFYHEFLNITTLLPSMLE